MAKLKCGCEPDASGYGWCNDCVKSLNNRVSKKMSEENKIFKPSGTPDFDSDSWMLSHMAMTLSFRQKGI